MKVQCDVCEAAEALVVCCADEAALCKECDIQVHDANKLASKHQRVPLFRPATNTPCDICQEKTAYFFCLEDRALLCHNCDMSIHLSNASTSNHRRFLITGITASLHTVSGQAAAASEVSSGTALVTKPESRSARTATAEKLVVSPVPNSISEKEDGVFKAEVLPTTGTQAGKKNGNDDFKAELPTTADAFKKTSIFEFLTEAVPGWKFDELINMPDMVGGCSFNDVEPFKMDANFNWTANIFDEQIYSRSVPQMNASSRSMEAPMKSRVKQDIPINPGQDDAFIVPDLGLHSGPELPPVTKRRRCSLLRRNAEDPLWKKLLSGAPDSTGLNL